MKLNELPLMLPGSKDWVSPAEFQALVEDHKALRGKVMMMFEALRRKGLLSQGDLDEAGQAMEKEFYEALEASETCSDGGRPASTPAPARVKRSRKTGASFGSVKPVRGVLRGREATVARKAK